MSTFIALLLIVGVIVLQVFLCKRESRIARLVLPVIAFLYSLLFPLIWLRRPRE